MSPLAGRVILVTGASSGVGLSMAEALAADGAAVACCARRIDRLAALVAAIAERGGRAAAIACDVADAGSIATAFDAAEAALGPVDSVIVNAGINHAGPALTMSTDSLDAVLGVNLRGAFLTATEGARRMIARDVPAAHRRVVFVASILGQRPMAGAAVYAASKAGVIMLAKALALEWARRSISVNALCPGFMPTEIVDEFFETEVGRRVVAGWPRRAFMPIDALLPSLRTLLAAEGAAITGTTITIDDGQSLG